MVAPNADNSARDMEVYSHPETCDRLRSMPSAPRKLAVLPVLSTVDPYELAQLCPLCCDHRQIADRSVMLLPPSATDADGWTADTPCVARGRFIAP